MDDDDKAHGAGTCDPATCAECISDRTCTECGNDKHVHVATGPWTGNAYYVCSKCRTRWI